MQIKQDTENDAELRTAPPGAKIDVEVQPRYLAGHSQPENGLFFYAYTVTITNTGNVGCQLLSRHWVITDGTGQVEEVRGPGVIGQQPYLHPGVSFTYTSGCPLRTTIGSMYGSYQMVVPDSGEVFDAEIPPFALSRPELLN